MQIGCGARVQGVYEIFAGVSIMRQYVSYMVCSTGFRYESEAGLRTLSGCQPTDGTLRVRTRPIRWVRANGGGWWQLHASYPLSSSARGTCAASNFLLSSIGSEKMS